MAKDKITVTKGDRKRYIQHLYEIGTSQIGQELLYLLKGRYKVLYIRSTEERRVLEAYRLISLIEGYNLYQWDFARGVLDSHSLKQAVSEGSEAHSSASGATGWILDQAKVIWDEMEEEFANGVARSSQGSIFVLLDFQSHLFGNQQPLIERHLKEFASIPGASQIVIVSATYEVPESIESDVTFLEFPFPSKEELRRGLRLLKKEIVVNLPHAIKTAENREEDLIRAVSGLTLSEAENALAKSLVKKKDFDIPTILEEKRQCIRKSGIVEYRQPKFSFDDIGGLGNLKDWLHLRRMAFSDDAAQYGLSSPKGIMMIGVPGCGKSMTCDAIAHNYEMPLLRLDVGSLFGSLVGQSEQNTRDAIRLCEAVSPCILWIDEVEKGISGGGGGGRGDSGTSSRVFSTLLTWMQEKTAPVFVACTANNVEEIPPEFMRAGRFDEIFFIDLPNEDQREEVVACLLRRKNRNPENFDIKAIVQQCEYYSPAEIEKGINNAMFCAYADSVREVTTEDIASSMRGFQPLYNSRREVIDGMRRWALGEEGKGARAVLANSQQKLKRTDYANQKARRVSISELEV